MSDLESKCGSAGFHACMLNQLASGEAESTRESRCSECQKSVAELDSELAGLGRCLRDDSDSLSLSDVSVMEDIEQRVASDLNRDASPLPRHIGPYRIEGLLGRGGMGAVYRAQHQHLKKDVAIKVLPTADSRAVARFSREMEAVGKLEHPNVIRAFDAGEEDGTRFLITELVPGVDLSRLFSSGRSTDVASACELVRQAAVGLQHAHDLRLIHRDVKPANLMLTADVTGQVSVKVMDLGLAMLSSSTSEQLTDQGQLMGTLEFMAPEQATSPNLVDHRADIYALGATLFRLLTGSVPFDGPEYDTPIKRLSALSNAMVPSIATRRAGLPPALVAIVDSMLAVSPDERPQSMGEVEAAMAPFSEGHSLPELCEKASLLYQRLTASLELLRAPDDTSPTAQPTLDESPSRAGQPDAAEAATSPIAASASDPMASLAGGSRGGRGTQERGASRWWRAILVGVIGAVALGGVIWLQTNGGYVRIEAPADIDVTVRVMQDGKQVRTIDVDRRRQQIWLRAGQYEIRLPAKQRDQFSLKGDRFTLRRKRSPVVRIEWVRKVARQPDGEHREAADERSLAERQRDDRVEIAQIVWASNGKIETRVEGLLGQEASYMVLGPGQIPAGPFSISLIEIVCGDATLARLVTPLRRLPEMPSLLFNGSGARRITDRSIVELAKLTRLGHLAITQARISDDGMARLPTFRDMNRFDLQYLDITAAGLKHVPRICPNLRAFGLLSTSISPDDDMSFIGELDDLRDFDLNISVVSAATLAGLKKTRVNVLAIRGADRMLPEVGPLLASLPLEKLAFQNSALTDQHLEALVECKPLVRLEVAGTRVTSAGIERFRQARKDVYVHIEHPPISKFDSPEGPFGGDLSRLKQRVVGRWLLDEGGAFRVAGGEFVRDVKNMPQGDFQISAMELYNTNPRATEVVAAAMRRMPGCRELVLSAHRHDTHLGDACLNAVAVIEHLERLQLRDFDVTATGLAKLKDLKSLRELRLVGAKVDAELVTRIQQDHPALEVLELRPSFLRGDHLKPLEAMERLKTLTLGGERCTKVIAEAVASSAASDLILQEFLEYEEGSLEPLVAMNNLKSLSLSETKFGDSELRQLIALESLERLSIDRTSIRAAGLQDFMERRKGVVVTLGPNEGQILRDVVESTSAESTARSQGAQ